VRLSAETDKLNRHTVYGVFGRACSVNTCARRDADRIHVPYALKEHLPVHIAYFTAWVNPDGLLT